MIVEANGRKFEFPDGTTNEQISQAVDEFFNKSEPTKTDAAIGVGENILSIGSSIIAEPLAGLAGIAQAVNPLADEGAGARAVEATREALTYQPRAETSKDYQKSIAETLKPVGEAMQGAEKFLGDNVLEVTGSPALAAGAATIPTAVLELIGVKGTGTLKRADDAMAKSVPAALQQAAPDVKDIKSKAKKLYDEVSESGALVDQEDYLNLAIDLNETAKKSGFDANLTPKSKGVLQRVESDFDKDLTVSDIDQLRKVAQVAANSIDNPTDAAIGSKIIDKIDDFLDGQGAKLSAKGGADVGKKYKEARALWQRVKKVEQLDEAVFRAENAASGFENGLRNEMRAILRNKKKRRGYNSKELATMQKISQGGTLENTMKRLSRLGYGADQQTNVLAALMATGVGAQLLGPVGAVAPVLIGNTAASIAKRLGNKNQQFLNTIARAGSDAEEITKAYMKAVPKDSRKVSELSALLIDPNVTIKDVKKLKTKFSSQGGFVNDALFMAEKLKPRNIYLATVAASVPGVLEGAKSPQANEQEQE